MLEVGDRFQGLEMFCENPSHWQKKPVTIFLDMLGMHEKYGVRELLLAKEGSFYTEKSVAKNK